MECEKCMFIPAQDADICFFVVANKDLQSLAAITNELSFKSENWMVHEAIITGLSNLFSLFK